MSWTRREFAAGALAAGVAPASGCLGGLLDATPPDVVVFNDTETAIESEVVVAPADGGDPVVDDAPEVDSMAAVEYPDALPTEGRFRFAVDVDGGRSGAETLVVESEAGSLQAVVGDAEIEFRKR